MMLDKRKRAFDLALALTLFPIAFAVCIITAIPIAIEARASPLFFQTRIGLNERQFRLLKMRTMRASTPHVASHKVDADYILSTGRLLRFFKLDELPQIWNVLNGTMSFVGPRPCLANQLELLDARRRHGVFSLVPGITGIAQIRGVNMSTPELLAETDKRYMQTWSLLRDAVILYATITGAGAGDAITVS